MFSKSLGHFQCNIKLFVVKLIGSTYESPRVDRKCTGYIYPFQALERVVILIYIISLLSLFRITLSTLSLSRNQAKPDTSRISRSYNWYQSLDRFVIILWIKAQNFVAYLAQISPRPKKSFGFIGLLILIFPCSMC